MTVRVLRTGVGVEGLLDGGTVLMLRDTLGEAACADFLEDACFRMTEELAGLETPLSAGAAELVRERAGAVAALAGQVGLPLLARAAEALADCAGRGDRVAMRATGARLLRVGEESLFALARLLE